MVLRLLSQWREWCGDGQYPTFANVNPANSLIEQAASYYQEILDRGVPISRGGEFVKYDGMKVLYRSIILPMSDDGITVSGLLGAANCREVPNG